MHAVRVLHKCTNVALSAAHRGTTSPDVARASRLASRLKDGRCMKPLVAFIVLFGVVFAALALANP